MRAARLLSYTPIALLIIVALNQIILAHTVGLSAWQGGGFGMFSTTDSGSNRHVHVFAVGPDIVEEVPVPESLADLERRARALPSDSWLKKLAREVADGHVRQDGSVEAIRVEVWRTEFDPVDLTPHGRRLRAFVLEVDGG
jgi:hypothetical protein